MSTPPSERWKLRSTELLTALAASPSGLSSGEAEARLKTYGTNALVATRKLSALRLFVGQVKSPLVLLLVFAGGVSLLAGEWVDAGLALAIVAASSLIGTWREYDAGRAIERLKSMVVSRTRVLRDGQSTLVPSALVVPGDVVLLSAGTLIPADGVLLEANDFFVSQALLTGEALPVEKRAESAAEPAAESLRPTERKDAVFQGTNVRSGSAKCLVIYTGRSTMFGAIADKLNLRPPETDFDRGLRHFGNLLVVTMLIMVLGVVVVNVALHRPLFDSLLFAIALAVGLAPEMLPAVLSVNLAKSAQAMSRKGVLVRRLNAIENFGAMDVLCTDKTGTLTVGEVKLAGSFDPAGVESPDVLREAAVNSHFETGLNNPLDEAIEAAAQIDQTGIEKIDEIPYDFLRKRLSVVVKESGVLRMITKGAVASLLDACLLAPEERKALLDRAEEWGSQGYRVLGVATKITESKPTWHREDEVALTFRGFLTFFDPPKPSIRDTLTELQRLGVSLKLISGDSRAVNIHLAKSVGLRADEVLTGANLDDLSDEALWARVESTEVFAQVDPNQKERIILALKKRGHVVGYMGDGINDAPALHAADVSISVDSAVDVAKEAADFVLLESNLDVLRGGILEGRTTFANTLKYILTTTSANLGNMLSMAVTSVFLPFLPLLASQILLNNLLSDVPAMALAGDSVDAELIQTPRRWDMTFIRRFMIQFGMLSSLFDLLTFGMLLKLFQANVETFRTGWFVESMLTELVIALVVRTRRPFFRSRPGTSLLALTVIVAAIDLAIPYLPYARVFGFTPLPLPLLLALVGVTMLYVASTELLKLVFYRAHKLVQNRP